MLQCWVLMIDDSRQLDDIPPRVFLNKWSASRAAMQIVTEGEHTDEPVANFVANEIEIEQYSMDWTQYRNVEIGIYVNMFKTTIEDSDRVLYAEMGEPRPAFREPDSGPVAHDAWQPF